VLYLLSPVALWQLARERGRVAAALDEPATRFFAVVLALPFGFFAALSAGQADRLALDAGLRAFLFRRGGWLLSREQLRRSVLYLGAFSALHVVAIVAAAMLPLDTWKSTRFYDGIVYHARMPEILLELNPTRRNSISPPTDTRCRQSRPFMRAGVWSYSAPHPRTRGTTTS